MQKKIENKIKIKKDEYATIHFIPEPHVNHQLLF
jgi:hypothetical protein